MISAFNRVVRCITQRCCRHDDMRRTGDGRMWLECAACGRETSGIRVRSREATGPAYSAAPDLPRLAAPRTYAA
jgi:hypothetical protein